MAKQFMQTVKNPKNSRVKVTYQNVVIEQQITSTYDPATNKVTVRAEETIDVSKPPEPAPGAGTSR